VRARRSRSQSVLRSQEGTIAWLVFLAGGGKGAGILIREVTSCECVRLGGVYV